MFLLLVICFFFFFKQKTAYEMRISDWSSDVCSSDLVADLRRFARQAGGQGDADPDIFEPGEPRPLGKRPAIGANIRAAEKGQREPRFPFGAAAAVKIYDVAAGRNVGIVVSHDDETGRASGRERVWQ